MVPPRHRPGGFCCPSRPDNGGVAYEITALIGTLPSGVWTPDVVRDAEVSITDDAVRIEFANGGYVEFGEHRYTCRYAAGCVIDDGTVRSGRILQTSSVPLRDFDFLEDNRFGSGVAYADGTFYVVDSARRKVYAYDGSGQHNPALSFDLAADTHTAAGIAYGDGRFYVVDELDIPGGLAAQGVRLRFPSDSTSKMPTSSCTTPSRSPSASPTPTAGCSWPTRGPTRSMPTRPLASATPTPTSTSTPTT